MFVNTRLLILYMLLLCPFINAGTYGFYPFHYHGSFSKDEKPKELSLFMSEIGMQNAIESGRKVFERSQLNKIIAARDIEKRTHIRDEFPLLPGADTTVHGIIIKEKNLWQVRIVFLNSHGTLVKTLKGVPQRSLTNLAKESSQLFKNHFKTQKDIYGSTSDKATIISTSKALWYAEKKQYAKSLALLREIAKKDLEYTLVQYLIDDISSRLLKNLHRQIWISNNAISLFTHSNTQSMKEIQSYRNKINFERNSWGPSTISALSALTFGSLAAFNYSIYDKETEKENRIPGHIFSSLSAISFFLSVQSLNYERKITRLQVERGKWSPFINSFYSGSLFYFTSPNKLSEITLKTLNSETADFKESGTLKPYLGLSLNGFYQGREVSLQFSFSGGKDFIQAADTTLEGSATTHSDTLKMISVNPLVISIALKQHLKKSLKMDSFSPYVYIAYEYHNYGIQASGSDQIWLDSLSYPNEYDLHNCSLGAGLSFLLGDDYHIWIDGGYRIPISGSFKEIETDIALHEFQLRTGISVIIPKYLE